MAPVLWIHTHDGDGELCDSTFGTPNKMATAAVSDGKVEEGASEGGTTKLIGAVFDLDGTLLGTEEAYLEAYTQAAERYAHAQLCPHDMT